MMLDLESYVESEYDTSCFRVAQKVYTIRRDTIDSTICIHLWIIPVIFGDDKKVLSGYRNP
jgi:hypothetical protein